MHLQKLGPKNPAKAVAMSIASWESPAYKIDTLSNVTVILQTSGVSSANARFDIQFRSGKGTFEDPYSEWVTATLGTPLIVLNANINEGVILTELAFDEVKVILTTPDPAANGTFNCFVQGRGFH